MNYFSYIFVAYLLIGVAVVGFRSGTIVEMDGIRKVLEETALTPAAAALPGAAVPMRSMSAGAGGAD
jgi:hypothetical protein